MRWRERGLDVERVGLLSYSNEMVRRWTKRGDPGRIRVVACSLFHGRAECFPTTSLSGSTHMSYVVSARASRALGRPISPFMFGQFRLMPTVFQRQQRRLSTVHTVQTARSGARWTTRGTIPARGPGLRLAYRVASVMRGLFAGSLQHPPKPTAAPTANTE